MGNAKLSTCLWGGYVVVALHGELDALDAEAVAGAVMALVDGRPLVIDLTSLDFIDCRAVGALRQVRQAARLAGGDVLLAAPHGPVQRLLSAGDTGGCDCSATTPGTAAREPRAARAMAARALSSPSRPERK